MHIGTLGKIVFEVSDSRVFTPSQVTRERKARIEEHHVQGNLPCVEFLAPELGTFSLTMTLNARPRHQPMYEQTTSRPCKRGGVNPAHPRPGWNWGQESSSKA